MELLDIYNEERQLTGRLHRRGERLRKGDHILVVCVWVTDGAGRLLLTLRAPEKPASPNTWENSGGAAKAGETSRQAMVRELREETGICIREEELVFLETDKARDAFFDFYFLVHPTPVEDIVFQPGETAGAMWATLDEIEELIRRGQVAPPIARRFRHQRELLEKLLEPTGQGGDGLVNR